MYAFYILVSVLNIVETFIVKNILIMCLKKLDLVSNAAKFRARSNYFINLKLRFGIY